MNILVCTIIFLSLGQIGLDKQCGIRSDCKSSLFRGSALFASLSTSLNGISIQPVKPVCLYFREIATNFEDVEKLGKL